MNVADGQAGDARALAFSGQEPMPSLPDVPTLKELGYDIDVSTPRGLVVAPGVDRGVQQWWIDTMKKVVKLPEWRECLKQNGLNEKVLYGEDFTEYLRETQNKLKNTL
jgi:putative tricarboxylic transport membrane protein